MKKYTINELAKCNFNVQFLDSLKQFWHNTKSFQCINEPKKQNLFLYVNGCTMTYKDIKGNIFVAQSGDIVYTPVGSEYKVQLSDFESENSHTVGINFLLFDESGEQLVLSDSVEIFRLPEDSIIPMLFNRTLVHDVASPVIRKKILLMEIICTLASYTPQRIIPERILFSLQYLSDHIEDNPTVSALADLCSVSEVYFRKQFKNSIGMTPLEYRNFLRFDKARTYLEYGDISVQEISDMLGYATVSHFIKEFKEHYEYSPLKYRNLFRKGSL